MRRDVFQAIADPHRREIINLLAHQNLTLNGIAENFNISRPAVSKHVRILTECGLIMVKVEGREHLCEAQLGKLNEVAEWIEQYKKLWNNRLDALEHYLSELQINKNKKHGNKKSKRK